MSSADAGGGFSAPRRSRIVPVLLACSAAGWVALVAVYLSPWSGAFEHRALEHLGALHGVVAILAAGWVLMVVAMMLPTSLPLFASFGQLTASRRDRGRLTAILVGGYLLGWAAIGVAMHVADLGVHLLVDHWIWLESHEFVISAATLGLAGVYQFGALKERCATRCRTPQGFIRVHWQGRSAPADTARLALGYTASCVGCCWALMLVMFAVGVGSIVWMAVLTVVMVAEKTHAWGPALKTPVAVGLLAGALVTLLAG